MSIRKITDEEIRNAQIEGNLPNRPTQKSLYPDNTLTAEEVKAAFDKLPKLIAARYNEVVSLILGENGQTIQDKIHTGIREGHTLKDLFQDIINGNFSFGNGLPYISEEDNDKILMVENGKWIAKHFLQKEKLPFFFTEKEGIIEDDAIYQKIVKDKLDLFLVTDNEDLILLSQSGLEENGSVLLLSGQFIREDQNGTLYQIRLFSDRTWSLTECQIYEQADRHFITINAGESSYGITALTTEELSVVMAAGSYIQLTVNSMTYTCTPLYESDSVKTFAGFVYGDNQYYSISVQADGSCEWRRETLHEIGENADIPHIISGTSGSVDETVYQKLTSGNIKLSLVTETDVIVNMHLSAASIDGEITLFVGQMMDEATQISVIYQVTLLSDRTWTLSKQDTSQSIELPTEQFVTLTPSTPDAGMGRLTDEEMAILSLPNSHLRFIYNDNEYICTLTAHEASSRIFTSNTFISDDGTSYVWIRVQDSQAWVAARMTIDKDETPGNSITITHITESTEDGGSNVVTFSDGTSLTIKNGSKGSTGAQGQQGDKGEKGDTGEKGEKGAQGPKGDTGASGVHVGESEPTDSSSTVWINPNGGVAIIPTIEHNTCSIFRKVVCVGDSFTSGHIDTGDEGNQTNEAYSWPGFMAKLTGNEYINCGASGATVKSWLTMSRGLTKAKSTGVVQAYLVGLGLNDVNGVGGITLGTVSDIGTDTDTYYAGLSRIVRELNTISPKAKIFLQTMASNSAPNMQFNQAIRDVVAAYADTYPVHLLDLETYLSMYKTDLILGDKINGHYTAIGYQMFAENLRVIWSEYINNHIAEFQDVFTLPYGTN